MSLITPFFSSPSSRSGEGGSRSETGGELGIQNWDHSSPSVTPQEARHLPHFVEKDKKGCSK